MSDIESVLERAAKAPHASVALVPGSPPGVRRGGGAIETSGPPVEAAAIEAFVEQALTPSQRDRLDAIGHVRFASSSAGVQWIGTCQRSALGTTIALRVAPEQAPTVASLGCPDAFAKLAERSHGVIIVAGPPGSGRTMALAAIARHAAETRGRFVVTIEDPTEVTIVPARGRVSQRELDTDGPPSVAAAFSYALGEGAEVVCIDAPCDEATVEIAIDAACSGRLIVLRERARGASDALARVLERLPDFVLPALGWTLAGVVALELLESQAEGAGLVAAHEILIGGTALAGFVRERRTDQIRGLLAAGQAVGMQTLELALERLVARGAVTREAALAVALDPTRLQQPRGAPIDPLGTLGG